MGQCHAMFFGNLFLTLFNNLIRKLDHTATIQTHQMIMVMLLCQFKYGLAAFEMMTSDNAGIIKLIQNPINGSQTNFFTIIQQQFIKVFSTDVLAFRLAQVIQDLNPRRSDF